MRFAAILLGAVVAVATLGAAQDGGDWVTIDSEHGRVVSRPRYRHFAQTLVDGWAEQRARVAAVIGIDPPRPTTIVIGRDAADVAERLGTSLPGWIAGVALKGRATIGMNASSLSARSGTTPGSVLRHELCHLAIGRRTRGRQIPRWLEEGICQVVGGRAYLHGTLQNSGPLDLDALIPWSGITQSFPRGRFEAARAYEQSFSFVTHLNRARGGALLRELIDATASGKTVSQAFVQSTGRAMVDFEREWLAGERRRRRGWLSVLQIVTPLSVASILVLFAFRRRRRRDRVLRERMEAEEATRYPSSPR